ncbi:hypothetical protein [Neomegalonema sp.]|uniref:hypothetical protein n=1 Tax=Neomegalonema sp. TaxID=2039713 RepID=UPI0026020A0C|nr:hypothetical protein [Neomegalonema sp.]MDD2869630.1 hypothetical protein [Neomegalonema sp.]
MKQTWKERVPAVIFAVALGIVIGATCSKMTAQTPAPEPAVGNLILLMHGDEWKCDSIPFKYEEWHTPKRQVKLDSLCRERGHILGISTTTLALPSEYYVDLPDRTLRIYHDPNYSEGRCMRCGRVVRKQHMTKPDTTIIWSKYRRELEFMNMEVDSVKWIP